MAEKRYRLVGSTDHWRISEDGSAPAGDYATREGALEALYLAVSNDTSSQVMLLLAARIRRETTADSHSAISGPLQIELYRQLA